jgi:hypothetical protein
MPSDDERREPPLLENAILDNAGASNTALASRFHQMFPVLSAPELDRIGGSAKSGSSLSERSCSTPEKPFTGCT